MHNNNIIHVKIVKGNKRNEKKTKDQFLCFVLEQQQEKAATEKNNNDTNNTNNSNNNNFTKRVLCYLLF